MTKKIFRNTILFFTFVFYICFCGIFLNSCSNLISEKAEENTDVKIATVSFAISESLSVFEDRTVLPNPTEQDLKKYLYLYNYTLTYSDENDDEEFGVNKIICNDFSYEKFCKESTIRLATGKKYTFTLQAKDGAYTRMEGSSLITLNKNQDKQTVTIVLMPVEDPNENESGQKLRVDWIVPDDGVIKTMKAGISSERGQSEAQKGNENLDTDLKNYEFKEYVFSVIDNPFKAGDPYKDVYKESTVKRIGITLDNVKPGVSRWLDYKFYDENDVIVYESSESVYMIGGKTSSAVIYITPDHYFRRPVSITINKDNAPWANNPELELKLVDRNENGKDIVYILKPVLDSDGNPTGEFKGLLPGASFGEGSAEATDGKFEIYVGVENIENPEQVDFISSGLEYNANTGKIEGSNDDPGTPVNVDLVTVPVLEPGVNLIPVNGAIATDGGLIVPAGQDFTVKVEFKTGYGPDGSITVCGKPIADDGVTLNTNDFASGISISGIKTIEYNIVYKSEGNIIGWNNYTPATNFFIDSAEIELPNAAKEENFADDQLKRSNEKIGGWWFGAEENKSDNIIHKINAEKAVKEKLIQTADENNNVVLYVHWIPSTFVEYKIVYEFEDFGSSPATYSEDANIVSFHNVAVEQDTTTEIKIPQVPGFTAFEIITEGNTETPAPVFNNKITLDGKANEKEYITKEVHYKRNPVSIILWNYDETIIETLSGKFGESYEHIADPVREDHEFLGWYVKGDPNEAVIKHVDNHVFPAENKEYVAKWKQIHANYTVEFWYETKNSTVENPEYEMTSRYPNTDYPELKGIVDSFPAFNTTPKEAGFTYKGRTITDGTGNEVNVVKADGTTLVKLYFDRKTVEFTLKANGGKFTDGNGNFTDEIILEGKYGSAIPLADSRGFRVQVPQPPVLEGIDDGSIDSADFTFKGWHVDTEDNLKPALPSPFEFPAENAIYAARWNPVNGIYKVVHWAESMDKYGDGTYKLLAPKAIDGFTNPQMQEGSVTKKGKIGSPMVYIADSVTGFEAPTVEIRNSLGTTGKVGAEAITDVSKKITADAKTEVIVTYLRKDYTINFHLNAGGDTNAKWCGIDAGKGSTETVTRTGKYRMDFDPPDNPVREHFIFRGWTTKVNGTLDDRVDVVPSYKDDAPTHYYAVWYSKASGGLETDKLNISLSCSVNGSEIAANVSIPEDSGEMTYSWNVNNVPVSAGSSGVTFEQGGKVLKLSGCLKKDYEITVVVMHNGKVYTKTEIVTVR